jgi:hypothetical protein
MNMRSNEKITREILRRKVGQWGFIRGSSERSYRGELIESGGEFYFCSVGLKSPAGELYPIKDRDVVTFGRDDADPNENATYIVELKK